MRASLPLALLLLLLLPASCAPRQTPEVAACERQAEESPEYKDLLLKGAGSPTFYAWNQQALADAKRLGIQRCLRARGLAAPGGVERPQRQNSLFNGL